MFASEFTLDMLKAMATMVSLELIIPHVVHQNMSSILT